MEVGNHGGVLRQHGDATTVPVRTGQKNVKEVVSVIFAYLSLLRQPGGVCRQIFEESRQIALMRFNFRDKAEPSSIAQLLAGSMQTHDDKCVRQGPPVPSLVPYSVPLSVRSASSPLVGAWAPPSCLFSVPRSGPQIALVTHFRSREIAYKSRCDDAGYMHEAHVARDPYAPSGFGG